MAAADRPAQALAPAKRASGRMAAAPGPTVLAGGTVAGAKPSARMRAPAFEGGSVPTPPQPDK